MPLINCEATLDLKWSKNCVICEAIRSKTFAMTPAKLYVPVITHSSQNNAKILQQLKSVFKRKISWNKYQSKKSRQAQNQNLDFLLSPSFCIII